MSFSAFLVYASLSSTVQCTAVGNGDLMYSRFLSLWSVSTGVTEEGNSTRKEREMTQQERLEALDCLRKADELNNCGAVHVLELFYRFGMAEETFGIKRNPYLADKYLERKKSACQKSVSNHAANRN